MQTERVTCLTTPDHKAALDAFAPESGMSVGHVVREATAGYIARDDFGEDELRAAVIEEAAKALPTMRADLEAIRGSSAEARAAIGRALDGENRSGLAA